MPAPNIALKAAIMKSGLKQHYIEWRLGLPQRILSRFIYNTRKPTEAQKEKIAKILDVPVAELWPPDSVA